MLTGRSQPPIPGMVFYDAASARATKPSCLTITAWPPTFATNAAGSRDGGGEGCRFQEAGGML